jgi:hypothetical protein
MQPASALSLRYSVSLSHLIGLRSCLGPVEQRLFLSLSLFITFVSLVVFITAKFWCQRTRV